MLRLHLVLALSSMHRSSCPYLVFTTSYKNFNCCVLCCCGLFCRAWCHKPCVGALAVSVSPCSFYSMVGAFMSPKYELQSIALKVHWIFYTVVYYIFLRSKFCIYVLLHLVLFSLWCITFCCIPRAMYMFLCFASVGDLISLVLFPLSNSPWPLTGVDAYVTWLFETEFDIPISWMVTVTCKMSNFLGGPFFKSIKSLY